MSLFISPEGDYLVEGTSAFYDRIGYRNPDFDAGDYAVRNLGFIGIVRTDEGALKLRLRPDLLTRSAVETACRFLAEYGSDETEVEHFDLTLERWTIHVCPNCHVAQARIRQICRLPRAS